MKRLATQLTAGATVNMIGEDYGDGSEVWTTSETRRLHWWTTRITLGTAGRSATSEWTADERSVAEQTVQRTSSNNIRTLR